MIFYYGLAKSIQLVTRDDPTTSMSQKLLDHKTNNLVDLKGSGFDVMVTFLKKRNLKKIVHLPDDIGQVFSSNMAYK